MPRPSKRVAPDTLGGRLRTTRQSLHLSLAEVAGDRYSTSLISQIERNRVDPSTESLQYLSRRLKLPLDDLMALARQHRQSETEATLYKVYQERYAEINRLLAHNQPSQALDRFHELDPGQLPLFLRWRTLALRGQAYFDQRQFADAQRDFQSALTVLPPSVSDEEQLEVVRLRLNLAAATRELNLFELALGYYHDALSTMDASTPLRYVAEVHWGLALVYHRQAQNKRTLNGNKVGGQKKTPEDLLQEAWKHAEDARTLYSAIADSMNAALLQCQIALIEQDQGKIDEARQRLTEVLTIWKPTLEESFRPTQGARSYHLPERANVVSSTAYCLANLEYQARDLDSALETVQVAIQAGNKSYKLRRAEAFMMLGEILEARNPNDQEIEKAFRQAVEVLQNTYRLGVRIQAHYQLGRYLLSSGRPTEGQQEIAKAHELAGISRGFNTIFPSEDGSSHEV